MASRVALLAAAAASLALAPLAAQREAAARPQTVAVGYASAPALAAALAAHPGSIVRGLPALRVVEVAPARAGFAAAVRRLPGIRYAQPTAPRHGTAEPALAATAGVGFEWQYAATRSELVPPSVVAAAAGVTIAVVDTGADTTAPDLAAKSPVTWNVVTNSADVKDGNGHGTFVAALAAGSVDNGDGIAGFGGNAQLMIVQANRGDSSFTDLDEANAIVWAVDHGARIVNLSLGGPTTSKTERAAIAYAADHGVLLVAAAGNDYERGNFVEYPAALIQPVGSNGVGGRGLVVAASTAAGTHAAFSSTGSYVSLAAPGVDVLSAVSSTAPTANYTRVFVPGALAGVYGVGSGTSYAAPQVAGAAALVWAANPSLSAGQVAQILKNSATGHGAWNAELGYGVLDVAAAVAQAAGGPPPAGTVKLTGRRVGGTVQLSWAAGAGATAFRLKLSEDNGRARVLLSGRRTATTVSLVPGHTYVFTVDAVDGAGAAVASSAPFRVAGALPLVVKKTAGKRR